MMNKQKILLLTNGDAVSLNAIQAFADLFSSDHQVHLLSVLDPSARIGGNEDALRDLTLAQEMLRKHGFEPMLIERSGDLIEAVKDVVKDLGITAVVVGATKRNRLTEFITGSTFIDVVRALDIPVLAVPHAAGE